ncbi:hypothetical protein GF358_03585 [Candidatus Woesearchaeota archaeon]|nr:hypothetical protein [Candidatus Woesearchaeota archaeon]
MNRFIKVVTNLEWKKLLFFSILAIILQDVILERLGPLLFMNNTIYSEYRLFLLSTQFLVYLLLSFYLCRTTEENRFLHLTMFAVLATLVSSVLAFLIFLILSQQILNSLLASAYNLSLIFLLIIPILIGYFSEKAYSYLFPYETPFFIKLCLPLGIALSILTIIPSFYVPYGPNPLIAINGIPIILLMLLQPVLMFSANVLQFIPLFIRSGLFLGIVDFESPLTYLWFLILYYTLLFLFIGFLGTKFRKFSTRWRAVIIASIISLIVLLHIVGMVVLFMGLMLSGG